MGADQVLALAERAGLHGVVQALVIRPCLQLGNGHDRAAVQRDAIGTSRHANLGAHELLHSAGLELFGPAGAAARPELFATRVAVGEGSTGTFVAALPSTVLQHIGRQRFEFVGGGGGQVDGVGRHVDGGVGQVADCLDLRTRRGYACPGQHRERDGCDQRLFHENSPLKNKKEAKEQFTHKAWSVLMLCGRC